MPNFTQKNVTTLYHPLYSPDLPLPDYFLFPKLKMKLKGLYFGDVAVIQEAVTDELKKVQKEEFSAHFQKLYDRAKACIYANGAYFELKKKKVFVFDLKKISPKTFGSHCVLSTTFPRTFSIVTYVFVNVGDLTVVTPLPAMYVLRIKDVRR